MSELEEIMEILENNEVLCKLAKGAWKALVEGDVEIALAGFLLLVFAVEGERKKLRVKKFIKNLFKPCI